MLVQPFERPTTETGLQSMVAESGAFASPSGGSTNVFAANGNDIVSRSLPPWFGSGGQQANPGDGNAGSSLFGAIGALVQQLSALLQQLLGGGNPGGGFGNEQYFQNANGASTGDPHLSFNSNQWSNMASQPDLLHSNSFPGGYNVATQVTAPNQNGVTYNRLATITTNYGATSVSLDNSGNPSILRNGATVPVAVGQTLDLGNGETVSRNQQGLQMTACTDFGGRIATTLSANGTGVDVQTTASNVDLGGALVYGNRPRPLGFGEDDADIS